MSFSTQQQFFCAKSSGQKLVSQVEKIGFSIVHIFRVYFMKLSVMSYRIILELSCFCTFSKQNESFSVCLVLPRNKWKNTKAGMVKRCHLRGNTHLSACGQICNSYTAPTPILNHCFSFSSQALFMSNKVFVKILEAILVTNE